jgi:hypothetical protein
VDLSDLEVVVVLPRGVGREEESLNGVVFVGGAVWDGDVSKGAYRGVEGSGGFGGAGRRCWSVGSTTVFPSSASASPVPEILSRVTTGSLRSSNTREEGVRRTSRGRATTGK